MKYPSTPYLPWSGLPDGLTEESIRLGDFDDSWCYSYLNPDDRVIITEKMDGENTTILPDRVHARSMDSGYHASRTWVKNFASKFQHEMDADHRICGENLYATHSIYYENLPSYFLGFSMWQDDTCLSWDETLDYFRYFGINHVPVLFDGPLEEAVSWMEDYDPYLMNAMSEGYVIRNPKEFNYMNFEQYVAKWVRPDHVQTDVNWIHSWNPKDTNHVREEAR
jgi:hypothetical protein